MASSSDKNHLRDYYYGLESLCKCPCCPICWYWNCWSTRDESLSPFTLQEHEGNSTTSAENTFELSQTTQMPRVPSRGTEEAQSAKPVKAATSTPQPNPQPCFHLTDARQVESHEPRSDSEQLHQPEPQKGTVGTQSIFPDTAPAKSMPTDWPKHESADAYGGSVHAWDSLSSEEAKPEPLPGRESPLNRLELLLRGIKMVGWIENPNEPSCSITPFPLKFDDLRKHCILSETQNTVLPLEIYDRRNAFPSHRAGAELESKYTAFEVRFPEVTWTGRTGPETLVLQKVARSSKVTRVPELSPYISEISVALFKRDYDVDTLRYVFVTNVLDDNTVQLLLELENERTELGSQQIWQGHTEPYHEIMGTRIGQIVGYTLLDAFPRGTHRIKQIVSWMDELLAMLRFDVEPVSEAERVQFDEAELDRIRAEQVKEEEKADHLPDDPMSMTDMRYFVDK